MIVSDYRINDMLSNKKLNPIVTELFIRGIKLNIFLVLITKSLFAVSKNVRLITTEYLVMKTKESFNKSHLIVHQVLTFKTL